ncbi:MAG: hypothetical protein FWF46_03510 [Oscillospiraceae bacterium]|nr:hypothetical protein [Oscillospiraceae bacterium]
MIKKSKIILIVVSSIVLLIIVFLGVMGAGFLSFLIEIFSLLFILIGLGFRYGKKNLKIILSAIIVMVTLVIINMNMTNPFKNRIDNLTWYPQYFVIWVLPLLFLSIALVVKYCKRTLRIVLSVIIILVTLYCGMIYIDVDRVIRNEEPIFAWKTNNKSEISENVVLYKEFGIDYRVINTTLYQGLVYKIIIEDYEYDNLHFGESTTLYMFGKRRFVISTESIAVSFKP